MMIARLEMGAMRKGTIGRCFVGLGAIALLALIACGTWYREDRPARTDGGAVSETSGGRADVAEPYTQQVDVAIPGALSEPFYIDVFTPTGPKNGRALIDVVSGAWYSDRGKLREHKLAQLYWILCSHGYTVFAVRPGSQPRYIAEDMVANVKTTIRWVKMHAPEYGIAPDKLGMTGASAGAHLAALAAVTPESAQPEAQDPLLRFDTQVAAVGIFFPPTDFLNWGGEPTNLRRIGPILFHGGVERHSLAERIDEAQRISPALRIGDGLLPPFLLFHGTADRLVPMQQSEEFVQAVKHAGGQADLILKKGGGHPWATIPEEIAKLADWFDAKLLQK